ncbi:hypothetical protein A7P53_00975 [Acinetobacter defluvii]|uniref:hypothetical protein n=1 Tax=Acinetobacter TaxID=469 RepID=UPI00148F7925|nr:MULTISPECIES: hypothetical protein [Acinetobacter]NNP73628.1 hypothetical protein [Acinetobacter defluvii]
MKYFLSLTLLVLTMTGCTSSPKTETLQDKATSNTSADTQVLTFSGPNGLLIFLKSSDNFETALMTDNSGVVYGLKQTVAGSGIRLANNNGVSIHFKRGEGVVEFVKDQPISITEVK